MALDFSTPEKIRVITREMMMDDAVERGDKPALRWLEDMTFEENTPVKDKDGNPTGRMKVMPIATLRVEYLKKYHGYAPPENTGKTKAERNALLRKKFADAFNKINNPEKEG